MSSNKRKNPRIDLLCEGKKLEIHIIPVNSSKKIPASIVNLSTGGIALNLAEPIQDELVDIQIGSGKQY